MEANTVVGIKSFGAYVPRRRMQRTAIADAHAWALPALRGLAKGEKSICGWDEDAITMAVEAGRDCLRGRKADQVASLEMASTTAPYADLLNASIVAAALRLPSGTETCDLGGSTRSGLSAVIQGCVRPTEGKDRLVIASDRRLSKPGSAQEMTYGSAAASVLIGTGDDVVARFIGAETVSLPFVDHFRQAGEKFDYYWEERWVRDEGVSKIVPRAVGSLLKRLNRSAPDVALFGMAGPLGSDKLVAKLLSIEPDRILPDFQSTVGDSGTGQSVISLLAALERAKPGDLIVIVSFGQGCEVVAFEMLRHASAAGRRGLAGAIAAGYPESAYFKMLSFDGHIELDWGMRAESDSKTAQTQLYRVADQILGFVGGKCTACDTVQFPRLPACVNCAAVNSQTPYPLADEPAKVATYTADWLQYSPSPPLYMGLIQFDVGARLLMEVVDVPSAGIDVDTPLAMTFRIKDRDRLRHHDRYFWKAVPVR